ncbi:hypothetical protein O6H91_20G029400 [Diphasiastrum complanatum]|uniref:Uncharacterized protein n=1 Tax=Diphasiastrum complanatum TaxID=34168 RepID=A0ACC2ANU3_DIPCM|nr:hypothetical protein O6H91_20G029400 [Diphasiastrum complanatum]
MEGIKGSIAAGWAWSAAAGATAALAAVLAKLASPVVRWEYRIISYAGVITCNVIMWSCYVRSLKALSSLQATVVNFAVNFILTGFLGLICFGETLHLEWFIGAFFIVFGIFVLSKAGVPNKDSTMTTKEE